jgi:hemolysin III
MGWLDFREPVSAWTHCAWMLLSLPAMLLLWTRSGGSPAKRLGLTVFGLSLAACYGASTLFHAVRLPPEQVEVFATLDALAIYLLIAGSVTPVALVVLRGWWRWCTLAGAWLLAAAGVGLDLAPVDVPPALSTGLYLGMGWGVALCYFPLARTVSHRALWPLVVGGVSYSVGAVLNRLGWPTLVPGVLGAHELFHLFVMGGSLAHFWFMLTVVAPFERVARVPCDKPSGDGRLSGASLEPGQEGGHPFPPQWLHHGTPEIAQGRRRPDETERQ